MHHICAMKTQHSSSGVEDRDKWRERIMRALQELQGQESLGDRQMQSEERHDETTSR
jgi:hypothetical protein